MELASILAPSAVKVLSTVSSKKRLFQDLGDIAADCYGINAEDAFAALSERENLGPTGVGRGVALPHARLAGVTEVTGCFVRVERPFDFDAVDRQPVDLIFALFAPEDSGVDHLKALALVSPLDARRVDLRKAARQHGHRRVARAVDGQLVEQGGLIASRQDLPQGR